MSKNAVLYAGLLLISISYSPAFAQEPSVDSDMSIGKSAATAAKVSYRTAKECAHDGVAVGGYDLISYRENNGPRLGRAEFGAEYGGGVYLFETAENRSRFLLDPIRFLPGYGGWCAISMALGRKTCPNHSNFKIENGELLLFELTAFTNGRSLWNTDPVRYHKKADINYERFLRK